MRRLPFLLGGIGLFWLVASIAWLLFAPGMLVKYPDDLDQTVDANGAVTLYVDPATGAPSETPQRLPLTITRNLKVVASSGDQATVRETSTERLGPAAPGVIRQQFVINRRTMRNVNAPDAYAYVPDNVTKRAPTYAINFPFDTGDGPYRVWKNETASAYAFRRAGSDVERAGVTLTPLYGSLADAPATAAYVAQLGLPARVAPAVFAPQLEQLLPALTATDRTALRAVLAEPVAIKYFVSVETRLLVEPQTGAIVSLDRIDQTISALPDLSGLTALKAMLTAPRYTDNETVQAALAALPAGPTRVLHMQYAQTPKSVAAIAGYADGLAGDIRMVERVIPFALALAGVLLLAGAVVVRRVRRPAAVHA